jgi:CPA2 family monovalent cation:H+ antiporter-2
VLPVEGQSLIQAGAILSSALNPLVFYAIEPLQRWIRSRSKLARLVERPHDPLAELPMSVDSEQLTGHVVLVGYGRVGRRIAESLIEHRVRFVVAEQNREVVEELRSRGVHAVSGNAADPEYVLERAAAPQAAPH